jgi:hypothetical protein
MRAGADCALAAQHSDTGECTSLSPPEKGFSGFGHVPGVPEAVDCNGAIDAQRQFSREWLFKTGAHTSSQRGVSGSVETGAQSVVVSRQREAASKWANAAQQWATEARWCRERKMHAVVQMRGPGGCTVTLHEASYRQGVAIA